MGSLTTTKAIVFDFGNVIININISCTFKAFSDLTLKTEAQVRKLFAESEIFKKYETGYFDDEEFRDAIRQTLNYPLLDDEIDSAWNALLLDIPQERIDYLENLKYKYPIYLLSNTNSLHIQKCIKLFKSQYNIPNFRTLFEHAFLSYEMKLWKPDYQIYEEVINHIGCKPEEILFLDDNQDNVDAASDMGIRCIKINPPESFPSILDQII